MVFTDIRPHFLLKQRPRLVNHRCNFPVFSARDVQGIGDRLGLQDFIPVPRSAVRFKLHRAPIEEHGGLEVGDGVIGTEQVDATVVRGVVAADHAAGGKELDRLLLFLCAGVNIGIVDFFCGYSGQGAVLVLLIGLHEHLQPGGGGGILTKVRSGALADQIIQLPNVDRGVNAKLCFAHASDKPGGVHGRHSRGVPFGSKYIRERDLC